MVDLKCMSRYSPITFAYTSDHGGCTAAFCNNDTLCNKFVVFCNKPAHFVESKRKVKALHF